MNGVQQIMALRQEVIGRSQALQDVRSMRGGVQDNVEVRSPVAGFADVLSGALQNVSQTQKRAGDMQVAFERGEITDVAQVMIARQEAGIAFEATLQVRNRLLTAYQEIMQMGG